MYRCIALCSLAACLHAATYEVGPGRALTSIGAVPWTSLAAGDTVLIHHRATPYREKWVLNRSGTASAPITVRGVADASGALPVISGENATTAPGLDFWNDQRGLLKIGGASTPAHSGPPAHIVIEGLELRSAYQDYSFSDDHGNNQTYASNAAGVYIETGSNITIRGCTITDNGNGIFCAGETSDLLIEDCHIHGNGVVGSIYEHNTYTEATGITYRGNRFDPLRAGALGNNLKDRSAGLRVEANWIEGGNRCLDLVDADDAGRRADPRYHETWVVGNILLKGDGGNGQVLHYGGDSGTTGNYRQGILFFHHNTVFSRRSGNTTLMRLSTNNEACDARNNIIHCTAGGGSLAMLDDSGSLDLRGNWLTSGWRVSHSGSPSGTVNEPAANAGGSDPELNDPASGDYGPSATSPNRDSAMTISGFTIERAYRPHSGAGRRYDDGQADRGAIEYTTALPRRLQIDISPAADRDAILLEPAAGRLSGDGSSWAIDDVFDDDDCRVAWSPSAGS